MRPPGPISIKAKGFKAFAATQPKDIPHAAKAMIDPRTPDAPKNGK